MSDVFISYSSKDREVAERIAQDLRGSGHTLFYDRELLPGEAWSARLSEELRRAKYVLVLLSPAYVESNWARRELEAAVLSETEGGPRLIPILIKNTEVPVFLRDRYYADLRTDYERGIEQVKKALAREPTQTEESKARLVGWITQVFAVMGGLFAAAASFVTSFVEPTNSDLSVIAVAVVGIIGLTTLVASISLYRPYQRAGSIETVIREVEQAYIDALDESQFNPLRPGKGADDG